MSEMAKQSPPGDLLIGNPVTRIYWSANGQFIILQFKDVVSDQMNQFFTTVFLSLYGSNIEQTNYLRAEAASIVKWTSCPTFTSDGEAISPQTYLDMIKASLRFKDVIILGPPEMIRSQKTESDAYCTIKLRFRDNPNGDILNSLVNKLINIFSCPHRTLAWIHKPAILQCSSCLRWGHHVSACRSIYPFCATCMGPHQTHSHDDFLAKGLVNSAVIPLRCINCTAAKKHANIPS